METILRVALENPTYESDFYAIDQILNQYGCIEPNGGQLVLRCEGNHAYTVACPSGVVVTHLLREYAIHHLLYLFYKLCA